MESGRRFRERLRAGEVCLGTSISFSDPTVSEALASAGMEFIWIDMEHAPLSLETVQLHIMAAQLGGSVPLVRVAWNDPVLIKQVLDLGPAGVIAPMVRSAAEARALVAACRYPPQGIRSFGPRRPSDYGHVPGPELCERENASVFIAAQVEHIDAVHALDEILAVEGLDSILIGPNDLSASMGLPAQWTRPEVSQVIESVVRRARASGMLVGMYAGEDPRQLAEWIGRGAQWVAIANDVGFMVRAAEQAAAAVRAQIPSQR